MGVPDFESVGREFESLRAHPIKVFQIQSPLPVGSEDCLSLRVQEAVVNQPKFNEEIWPELKWEQWKDTAETLHA